MHDKISSWMAAMLAAAFLTMALGLIGLARYQFFDGLSHGKELISVFVRSINTAIISLAIFELGIGIGKEYVSQEKEQNTYALVRRTIARFVGTVCIALVLDGLIMIIRYSQLDLAGNPYYPAGILFGASVLLTGMGLFLHLTRPDCESNPAVAREGGKRRGPAEDLRPSPQRAPHRLRSPPIEKAGRKIRPASGVCCGRGSPFPPLS